MAEEDVRSRWKEIIVGWIFLLLILGGAIYMAALGYTRFFKPAPLTISVAGYFVDETGKVEYDPLSKTYELSHLKIQGTAYQGDETVKSGTVVITVATPNDFFRQSVSVPLKEGRFESDDPAFRAVRPGMAIEIRADVTAQKNVQRAVIHLNSESPVDKTALEYGLAAGVLLLAVVFFLAFTGKKKAWRNQTAIIFSYVVIALFLAVPLLAPVMLMHTFPQAIEDMIGAPAGLINTHTANQEKCETQWALNIGGYSYRQTDPCTDKNKDEKAKGDAKTPGTKPASANPSAAAGKSGNTAGASGQNSGQETSQTDGGDRATASNPTTGEQSTKASVTANDRYVKAPIAEVQGGLVIPLYVIILSVIGGAINMTRKVPGFQKEGEESDFSIGRPISSLGSRVMQFTRMAPAPVPSQAAATEAAAPAAAAAPVQPSTPEETTGNSLEGQAREVEKKLEPLVVDQIMRNCESDRTLADIRALVGKMQELYKGRTTNDPLLKFDSFEDWAASHPRLGELLRGSWRVELLNQYMYLISAPFLAVVTYYILDLLGLSKQGVVVVLSFSVGLISEKIVSWILGIATGYMRTDTKKA